MFGLQRAAGNRAVQRLIDRRAEPRAHGLWGESRPRDTARGPALARRAPVRAARDSTGRETAAELAARFAREVDEAVERARVKLRSQSCRFVVSGSSMAALAVLDALTARKGDQPGIKDLPDVRKRDRKGQIVLAEVSKVGAGASGTITLYKDFHDIATATLFGSDSLAYLQGLYPDHVVDLDDLRALVILHEVAHLTGALTHGDEGAPDFNRATMETCVRGMPGPIPPTPSPCPTPLPRTIRGK
jgi:hypothetical protein